jgi:hypothetical protein
MQENSLRINKQPRPGGSGKSRFPAYRRLVAMAGEDARGRGKGEEPREARFQGRGIGIRAVRAADPVAKEGIAGQQDGGLGVIEANRPRRMPGAMDYTVARAGYLVAVGEREV